jgi:hypothetical protein
VKALNDSLSEEKDFDSCEGLLAGEGSVLGGASYTALVGRFASLFVSDFRVSDELRLRDLSLPSSVSILCLNGEDLLTTLVAFPSVSVKPSAAVFLFPAGDGDREPGIHDRLLNLADRWLADCG